MVAILKAILIATVCYTALYIACPKQMKTATFTVYSATYAQLASVGK